MLFPATVTLLGDAKVIVRRVLPVDQPDGNGLFSHTRLDLNAVAEQAVNLLVGVVKGLAAAERRRLAQVLARLGDDGIAVALTLQPIDKELTLNVAIAGAILPMPEIAVAQRVLEEGNDTLLCADFVLAYCAHCSELSGFCSTAARPLAVRRYFCSRLLGLAGMVISSSPCAIAGCWYCCRKCFSSFSRSLA